MKMYIRKILYYIAIIIQLQIISCNSYSSANASSIKNANDNINVEMHNNDNFITHWQLYDSSQPFGFRITTNIIPGWENNGKFYFTLPLGKFSPQIKLFYGNLYIKITMSKYPKQYMIAKEINIDDIKTNIFTNITNNILMNNFCINAYIFNNVPLLQRFIENSCFMVRKETVKKIRIEKYNSIFLSDLFRIFGYNIIPSYLDIIQIGYEICYNEENFYKNATKIEPEYTKWTVHLLQLKKRTILFDQLSASLLIYPINDKKTTTDSNTVCVNVNIETKDIINIILIYVIKNKNVIFQFDLYPSFLFISDISLCGIAKANKNEYTITDFFVKIQSRPLFELLQINIQFSPQRLYKKILNKLNRPNFYSTSILEEDC